MNVEFKFQTLVSVALQGLGVSILPQLVNIDRPSDKDLGDFSTNIALNKFSSIDKEILSVKTPLEFAEMIASRIRDMNDPLVERVEVARPGFVNFFINKKEFAREVFETVKQLHERPARAGDPHEKIIIEHTSVNPNKAMHIGHLRNAVLGDVLARLYKRLGYKVEVLNYIDDTGLQVADTTNAVMNLNIPQAKDVLFDDYCWDIYSEINKLYETNKGLESKRREILHAMESGKGEVYEISQEIARKVIKQHLKLMDRFDIHYDLLVYESDVIKAGFWKLAFEELKKSKYFVLETEGKNAGCWVLKYDSPKFGDKILVRSDGTLVYTAKDVAYHLWKFGIIADRFKYDVFDEEFPDLYRTSITGEKEIQSFGRGDRVMNMVDDRQAFPQEMVRYALKLLGHVKEHDNFSHISYGVVNISSNTAKALGVNTEDDKNSYAMSGRKGIGVKARDVFELLSKNINAIQKDKDESKAGEIASGALRHYMLKYNPSTEIVFDYEEALKTKGNTGPYLQYSFARASNILHKGGFNNYEYPEYSIPSDISDSEFELLKDISQWTAMLDNVAETQVLSYLAEYAFKLASGFHIFYEQSPVLKANDDIRKYRIMLVTTFAIVLEDVLSVMGIKALKSM